MPDLVLVGHVDTDVLIASPEEDFNMTQVQNQLTVVKGEDKNIVARIVDSDMVPFDLSDAEEITARFKKTDGTTLSKTINGEDEQVSIVGAPELGKIQVALTAEDTALLKADPEGGMELFIDIGEGPQRTIVQFRKLLNVVEKLFS